MQRRDRRKGTKGIQVLISSRVLGAFMQCVSCGQVHRLELAYLNLRNKLHKKTSNSPKLQFIMELPFILIKLQFQPTKNARYSKELGAESYFFGRIAFSLWKETFICTPTEDLPLIYDLQGKLTYVGF